MLNALYLYLDLRLWYSIIKTTIINSKITAAATAAAVVPTDDGDDDDDDDDDVWLVLSVGGASVTQSFESNESSIAGQSGSIAKAIPLIVIDGIDSTQSLSIFTISSASVTEAGTCKVIIAR